MAGSENQDLLSQIIGWGPITIIIITLIFMELKLKRLRESIAKRNSIAKKQIELVERRNVIVQQIKDSLNPANR